MNRSADVLIIGAGPAGMTAALQLKRSGIQPFLVERDRVGGALLNADLVENYPGFPEGISGRQLAQLFQAQISGCGIEVQHLEIGIVRRDPEGFSAQSSGGQIDARAIIVASGSAPLWLGIPGEENPGVYHEVRDVPAAVSGSACVIGGGDVAFDCALALAKRNVRVRLVMRSSQPRCLQLLEQRVRENPGIKITLGAEPEKITRRNGALELSLKNRVFSPLCCDAILVAVGRESNAGFIPLELQSGSFGKPPLLFAGDVVNGSFRQVGIAVGDGLRCAMQIATILKK